MADDDVVLKVEIVTDDATGGSPTQTQRPTPADQIRSQLGDLPKSEQDALLKQASGLGIPIGQSAPPSVGGGAGGGGGGSGRGGGVRPPTRPEGSRELTQVASTFGLGAGSAAAGSGLAGMVIGGAPVAGAVTLGMAAAAAAPAIAGLGLAAVAVKFQLNQLNTEIKRAKDINAAVAAATAQSEVRELMGDLRRARENQGALGGFVTARSQLLEEVRDLRAAFVGSIAPDLTRITQGLTAILNAINLIVDFTQWAKQGKVTLLEVLREILPEPLMNKIEEVIDFVLGIFIPNATAQQMQQLNNLLDPFQLLSNI